MSTASNIRRHIEGRATNAIFTSKQILRQLCVSRDAVDSMLSRLVKKKVVIRLAAGVFVLATGMTQAPQASEIAAAKAEAFGKRVLNSTHPTATPQENETEFLTDGCRTSFNSIHGRLQFKTVSMRKLKRLDLERKSSPLIQPGNNNDSTEQCADRQYMQSETNPAVTILTAVLILKQALCLGEANSIQFFNWRDRSLRLILPPNSTISIRALTDVNAATHRTACARRTGRRDANSDEIEQPFDGSLNVTLFE